MTSNPGDILYHQLRRRFKPLKEKNDVPGLVALRDELIEEANPGLWPHWLFLGCCYALVGEEKEAIACKEVLGRLLEEGRESRKRDSD